MRSKHITSGWHGSSGLPLELLHLQGVEAHRNRFVSDGGAHLAVTRMQNAMGIFRNIRRSASKSILMKSAAKKLKTGTSPLEDIFTFYNSDAQFAAIIKNFKITEDEVSKIMLTLMLNAGGTYRGHFVPISALLFPDTLVYMLRAHRGEVPLAEACAQVDGYFRTGAIIFDPIKRHG